MLGSSAIVLVSTLYQLSTTHVSLHLMESSASLKSMKYLHIFLPGIFAFFASGLSAGYSTSILPEPYLYF